MTTSIIAYDIACFLHTHMNPSETVLELWCPGVESLKTSLVVSIAQSPHQPHLPSPSVLFLSLLSVDSGM